MILNKKQSPRRFSSLGLLLAVLYLLWVALMIYGSFDADLKGNVVLLQLGVLPQSILVDLLGSMLNIKLMYGWNWIPIYCFLVPPMVIVLYFIGAWFQRLWKARAGLTKNKASKISR